MTYEELVEYREKNRVYGIFTAITVRPEEEFIECFDITKEIEYKFEIALNTMEYATNKSMVNNNFYNIKKILKNSKMVRK